MIYICKKPKNNWKLKQYPEVNGDELLIRLQEKLEHSLEDLVINQVNLIE